MVLFVSFITFSNICGKEKKNITSAIEGLHSTWLIVNNRIQTRKYSGWREGGGGGLAEKKNGKDLLVFFSPVQGMDLSIFSYPRVGSSQFLMTETGTLKIRDPCLIFGFLDQCFHYAIGCNVVYPD